LKTGPDKCEGGGGEGEGQTFPTPGSPPTRVREPGTTPPPKTLATSAPARPASGSRQWAPVRALLMSTIRCGPGQATNSPQGFRLGLQSFQLQNSEGFQLQGFSNEGWALAFPTSGLCFRVSNYNTPRVFNFSVSNFRVGSLRFRFRGWPPGFPTAQPRQ
jgi:hypothetical protein